MFFISTSNFIKIRNYHFPQLSMRFISNVRNIIGVNTIALSENIVFASSCTTWNGFESMPFITHKTTLAEIRRISTIAFALVTFAMITLANVAYFPVCTLCRFET